MHATALFPLADVLDWPFDMIPLERPRAPDGYEIAGLPRGEVFATDGTGAEFVLCGGAVVYVGSEGQAGLVGESLAEWMAVLVALPYWRDLCKFSAGGQLGTMRQSLARLEAELLQEEPDVDARRQQLVAALALALPPDPVALLHRAVDSGLTRVRILSPDGPYASLFGSFPGYR